MQSRSFKFRKKQLFYLDIYYLNHLRFVLLYSYIQVYIRIYIYYILACVILYSLSFWIFNNNDLVIIYLEKYKIKHINVYINSYICKQILTHRFYKHPRHKPASFTAAI